MNPGIQRKLEKIGKEGCFLLCILHVFGIPDSEIVRYYDFFLETQCIKDDCTILEARKICKVLARDTGRNIRYCGVLTQSPSLQSNELEIHIMQISNSNMSLSHFIVVNDEGEVTFDPLGDSKIMEGPYKTISIRTLILTI